jgi:ABC-type glycerol-3-phosphate transport system substrate-binding protein
MTTRMGESMLKRQGRRIVGATTLLIASVAALATAASASALTGQTTANTITFNVWTDQPRLPAFQAYAKLNPNIHFTYDMVASGSSNATVDGLTLEQRILLDNRSGQAPPDIAFIGLLNQVPQVELPTVDYAANLSSYVPKAVLDGYTGGMNDVCEAGGQVFCLRNDQGADVLWYNKPLMQKFGYSVPTTWTQYEQLGEEVAKQHPGYSIGNINGEFGLYGYFWAAQCPYQKTAGTLKVRVDMTAPQCVQMAKILDVLLKDKVVSTEYPFDASYASVMKNTLMMPAADWFGAYIFDGTFHLPAKQWVAALSPAWSATGRHWTGDNGGGVYMVSRKAKDIAAAAKVIEWIATNSSASGFEAHSVTVPAYAPAAATWARTGESGYESYFAANPAPVFAAAASDIWPGISYVGYNDSGTFDDTMTAAASSGTSLVKELPVWQSQVTKLLQAAGYQVVH